MTAAMRTLTITELAADEAERWDAFVAASPDASFFHRAGWKTVIEETFGHRTYYLQAEQEGVLRGILPLVHIRSRLFGNALVSNAFGVYGGPVAVDGAALELLDRHAVALAERLGVDLLEYRSTLRRFPDRTSKELYATFRKELDPDPEKNYLAIPRKQRAVVRQGLAAGLDARLDDDPDRLWRLYAENVRRHGTPVFRRALFANLKRVFGSDCELLVIGHGKRDVAGVLSFYFRDQVLPYYAGGTDEVRQYSAHDFMYWDLMRRACLKGCRIFDFGRSKKGTGPYSFKKNWGFKPEPLPYEYKLIRAAAVPDVNPLNPKYRAFIALWKRLPLPVANTVGPMIARNLG